MNNFTFNQKIAFAVAVFSFLAAGGGATDLTTLLGATGAKYTIALASLCAGIGGLFLSMVTGNANIIKDAVSLAKDPTSPIQGIITTNDKQGKDLAASIPGPIVSAGSTAATEIAKP